MAARNVLAGTASERIAEFAAGFEWEDAPGEATGLVQTALIDTVGVMLAGSREPAARLTRDMVDAEKAQGSATIVGFDTRTSPARAALVNGAAVQALDFDLSFMIGQSSAALFPALLPMAEATGASPRELMAGFMVGMEVCGTLARCFPTLSSDAGWHGTGVLGSVCAAVALARLTRAPARCIPDIIGIAASMASGISANFGTMTKPLHGGLAARNGVEALNLGRAGFTASADALAGADGFFDCFAQGRPWDMAPMEDLGRRWHVIDPGYKIKPFACGGLLHCSIEAALAIREAAAPAAEEIVRITIGVSQHAKNRAIPDYPWSEDTSRFALNYLVARALIHGVPGVEAFTEPGWNDPAVKALAARSEIVLDDELKHLSGSGYSPGRVTLRLKSGESLSQLVEIPSGAPERPMSDAQIRDKFISCSSRAIGDARATALFDYLSTIAGQRRLDSLWPMLNGGAV